MPLTGQRPAVKGSVNLCGDVNGLCYVCKRSTNSDGICHSWYVCVGCCRDKPVPRPVCVDICHFRVFVGSRNGVLGRVCYIMAITWYEQYCINLDIYSIDSMHRHHQPETLGGRVEKNIANAIKTEMKLWIDSARPPLSIMTPITLQNMQPYRRASFMVNRDIYGAAK